MGVADAGPAAGHDPTRRISDWVAEQLLDRIGRGELVPGQRLPGERQLAEQLHVSRVSVRAALQKLKTQGFLTAVQGGGTRVVSSAGVMDGALTEMVRAKLDNLYDLLELRIAMESWAARRAAERATPEQIDAISRVVDAMAQPGRNHGRDDMDFHLAIAQAAASPVYLHILATVRDILSHMVEFHHSPPFIEGQEALMLQHHRAIRDAIANRQGQAAAEAMKTHLRWVLVRYQQLSQGGNESPLAKAVSE